MSLKDRIARMTKERLELDQRIALEEAKAAETERQKALEDSDPFKNHRVPFSGEYRKFLSDRIQAFIRYNNIFSTETSVARMVKQFYQGYSTEDWEVRALFLKTIAAVLTNPRYAFELTGYSEYSLGGQVFKSDRRLYQSFISALGYDPKFSTRQFREFLDMYLEDRMPQTELEWRLLADPELKQQPSYDLTKMHPAEAKTFVVQDAFDGFGEVRDELAPDVIEQLSS
jgi:hypothetical protein